MKVNVIYPIADALAFDLYYTARYGLLKGHTRKTVKVDPKVDLRVELDIKASYIDDAKSRAGVLVKVGSANLHMLMAYSGTANALGCLLIDSRKFSGGARELAKTVRNNTDVASMMDHIRPAVVDSFRKKLNNSWENFDIHKVGAA